MTHQVAIYNQDNGVPAVMCPTDEALATRTILEIARADIPLGKPFAIINQSDLPLHIPQEAWEVDDAMLTDGVGEKEPGA